MGGLALAAVLLPGLGLLMIGGLVGKGVSDWTGWPWWTAFGFVAVAGCLVGLALMPTHLTSLLAGFLYGMGGGLIAGLGAVGVGTALGYAIAARLAPDRLREWVERSAWGRRLAEEMLDASPWRRWLVVVLARLPPQVPFALGNVLGASARVGGRTMVAGTLVGMLPRVGLVVWVGSTLGEWQPGAGPPSGLWWAVGLAIAGFGALALWSRGILAGCQRRSCDFPE